MKKSDYAIIGIFILLVLIVPVNFCVFLMYTRKNAAADKNKMIRNLESIEQVYEAIITDGLPKMFDYKHPCLCDVSLTLKNGKHISFSDIDSDLNFVIAGGVGSMNIPGSEKNLAIWTIEDGKFENRTLLTYMDLKVLAKCSGIKCSNVYEFFENYDSIIEYCSTLPKYSDVTDEYFDKYSVWRYWSRYLLVKYE